MFSRFGVDDMFLFSLSFLLPLPPPTIAWDSSLMIMTMSLIRIEGYSKAPAK